MKDSMGIRIGPMTKLEAAQRASALANAVGLPGASVRLLGGYLGNDR